MIVTIFQHDIHLDGVVTEEGYNHLASIEEAQERYLLKTYALPLTPRQGEGLPRKMCDAIRRITTLARKAETGVPTIKGILYPSSLWTIGIGSIMVRVLLAEKYPWWLALELESSVPFDRKKPITIVRR